MNIIILGDKYQKRMKSKGCVGLIKLYNKNILTHQYKILKTKFPNANIIYVYGFDNKRFLSYVNKNIMSYSDIKLVYNPHYEQYNNVYSLSLLRDYLNQDCLILFGDHIFKNNTFDNFKRTNESQIFINVKTKTKLGCIINNDTIENVSYDLDNYLSEIYFISKNQIQTFRNLITNPAHHNYFIFEILNKMIDTNQKIIPNYII